MKHSQLLTGQKTPSVYPIMHNMSKWPDTLQKILQQMLQVFKVCLTIFRRYASKG